MDLTKFKHKTFLEGNIILINADCVDVMREIPSQHFNLIISDGPYFKICGKFDWAFRTIQEWIVWHILLRDEWERMLYNSSTSTTKTNSNNSQKVGVSEPLKKHPHDLKNISPPPTKNEDKQLSLFDFIN